MRIISRFNLGLLFSTVVVCDLILISTGFVLLHYGGSGGGPLIIDGIASGRNYEIGTIYNYDYTLGVELNEPGPFNGTQSFSLDDDDSGYKTGSTVGYKVVSKVQVTPVWRNEPGSALLEIQLIKPQLQIKSRKAPTPEGFHDHSSELDSITLHPFYIYWKNGAVISTYSVSTDDISLVNIKKGIANLLQFQTESANGQSKVSKENTPLGKCNVTYSTLDTRHLIKELHGNCQLHSEVDSKFLSKSHASPVLGSDTESDINVQIKLTEESTFVEEATVTENHVVRVTIRREVGATINSSQNLKLSGTSTSNTQLVKAASVDTAILEIGQVKALKLVPETLLVPHPEKIPFCEMTQCKPEDSLLKVMTAENMATSKMANAFIQMVSKFRDASTEQVKKVLEDNPAIFPQLLDVFAATGSLSSHKAVMSLLDFNADDITYPERYLLGLALTTFPDKEIVKDIFGLSKTQKNEKLKESLILTTSALVHTVRVQSSSANFGLSIEQYVLESLSKCDEKQPECAQLYLRALKNLKSSSTVPTLFNILESSTIPKVAVVAMKALHSFPDSFFNRDSHREKLIRIAKQTGKTKYDSSTRTLAIDLIVRSYPSKSELTNMIVHLVPNSGKDHSEISTYLVNRILEFSETNPKLRTWLEEIINENDLKNYHYLSPKGLSTAFSRTFSANPSGNSSFSNAIEMTGKILKRSSFDVYVNSQDHFIHPLSLGIFAGGLGSFASSDNEETTVQEEEEEDATAGMELSLMGIQMRPIVFFVGKGELMGLVWSGAGSEKTTALQGNVLLQDEKKSIPLFSGLVADININGGLSFDLSGQIQISLWHRTANSLVENKAGLVLQSVIRVDTSFVRSRVDYTVASEAGLDFTSDINFYDGVLMCLKLTQPEFSIKQNIHKTERIPGSKHRLRKAKYKSIPVPGITYALNKKNSELCGKMYKDEL